jgi:hypothetical protein
LPVANHATDVEVETHFPANWHAQTEREEPPRPRLDRVDVDQDRRAAVIAGDLHASGQPESSAGRR